jgi:hypothetical protein
MGTIDTLPPVTMLEAEFREEAPKLASVFVQSSKPSSSRAKPGMAQASPLARVQISTPAGPSVQGVLKSISRGGIQIVTSIPVPTRCPLQIAIAGCRPIAGEALYSLQRSAVHRVGIVFTSRQKPIISVGAPAQLHSLEPPFRAGRGNVVDLGSSSVSIFGKTTVFPGVWIRVESGGWILFGVVKDLVPTGLVGRCLEVHLEAAFPADESNGACSTPGTGAGKEKGETVCL